MPELPEAETIRRQLAPMLIGKVISDAWARLPRRTLPSIEEFTERLHGQRFIAAARRGKQLYFPLNNGDHLLVHLGMTGRLAVEKSTFTIDSAPRHVQAALTLSSNEQLVFRDPRTFGSIGVSRGLPFLQTLGPEPLDDDFDTNAIAQKLKSRNTKIKSALLDQSLIAGLGNIYADEACFEASIHPAQIASSIPLTKLQILCGILKPLLERAINARGATLKDKGYEDIFGQHGEFIPHVYGRTGEPCHNCGAIIQRGVLGNGKS
ncbi:MAG: bifunctional DNA-formamidopyrimidine glycosylase/DNA-(apurinic or apyrimidinic site) lyase, partial [Abditibacteriaceae bacterium]